MTAQANVQTPPAPPWVPSLFRIDAGFGNNSSYDIHTPEGLYHSWCLASIRAHPRHTTRFAPSFNSCPSSAGTEKNSVRPASGFHIFLCRTAGSPLLERWREATVSQIGSQRCFSNGARTVGSSNDKRLDGQTRAKGTSMDPSNIMREWNQCILSPGSIVCVVKRQRQC